MHNADDVERRVFQLLDQIIHASSPERARRAHVELRALLGDSAYADFCRNYRIEEKSRGKLTRE